MKVIVAMLIFICVMLMGEANANQEFVNSVLPTKKNVVGVATLKPMPWWFETVKSIKITGGFKLGDVFFRRPDSTVPLSMRSSLKLTDTTRVKLKLGGDSSAEFIRYGRNNTEYYFTQNYDDSVVGWRVRF